MNRLSSTLAIALVVGLVAPLGASAQQQTIQDDATLEDEARALFEAGRTAYEGARYDAALNYFTQAYQIVPRPALLFNMAAAADRLQRSEQALEWYRQYITELPEAPNRQTVERRITFLEGILAEQRSQREQEDDTQTTETQTGPTGPADRPSGGGDITGEWWFWTIIAVAVVGLAVGIGAGVAVSSQSSIEEPIPGDFPATAALSVSF
jgi:tetratricopeptide (TPR) repeat protein